MKKCWIWTAAALAACGCAGVRKTAPAAAAAAAKNKTPNVVVILADDLGYGDTGCYGATAVRTPNIDSLARNGVQFSQGYAATSACSSSRYSLLTGIYAFRRGICVLAGDSKMSIRPGSPTLAQIFQDAGYRTGVIGKWHLGLGAGKEPLDWNGELRPSPLDVGFNYSCIMPGAGSQAPTVLVENRRVLGLEPSDPFYMHFRNNFPGEPSAKDHPELVTKMMWNKTWPWRLDNCIANGAGRQGFQTGGKKARWVDEELAGIFAGRADRFVEESVAAGKPFFLYYPLHQPHVPRMPNAAFVGKSELGPRGDVIAEADWQIGRLLKTLDRLGVARDTIVIFTSDNGPRLDDGYVDRAAELNEKAGHKPSGIHRGDKGEIYDGGVRVPFLVQWKGTIAPGKSDALVCQVDFLASFASMLGRRLPPSVAGKRIDSENTLDALLGRSGKGRGELLLWGADGRFGLRQGKYYMITAGRKFASRKTVEAELYDLEADPGQQDDLKARLPERVKEMTGRIQAIRAAK